MDLRLHQIAYSPETLAACDPGFTVLDNLANPRPDWWEIWPIVAALSAAPLDDDAWYGFFSPRFRDKTGLHAAQVREFVTQAAPDADLVSFSPQVDMGAFFLNLFEQNEVFDPGFLAVSQAWAESAGFTADLRTLLMDSRHVVISNYFVARGRFWRRWLGPCRHLIACCEDAASPLHARLVAATTYKGGAQRKVFLAERIASLILATEPGWRVRPYNPFALAWSASRLNQFPEEAAISDALKLAAREIGHPQYLAAFAALRARLFPTTPPAER